MPRSNIKGRGKEPSFTSLVWEYLQMMGDFATVAELIASHPDLNINRVTASLASLYKNHAVDFLVSEGVTYWFSTPETDTRTRVVEERVREEPGTRKTRRTK